MCKRTRTPNKEWRTKWITCQHLVHGGRHVHLRQALAALGVVEAHVRAALQRQPHALAVRHHAGDAAAAVGAHLEPLLHRGGGAGGWGRVMTEEGGETDLVFMSPCRVCGYLLCQRCCVDDQDPVLGAAPQLSPHWNHLGDGAAGRAEDEGLGRLRVPETTWRGDTQQNNNKTEFYSILKVRSEIKVKTMWFIRFLSLL